MNRPQFKSNITAILAIAGAVIGLGAVADTSIELKFTSTVSRGLTHHG